MEIHVGTSGYSFKEWKGIFYPEKIPPKEMLRFYAERIGTVEINNTFYHMPTENVLLFWAEQVPEDFLFAFKAPQVITHFKRLKNVDEELGHLVRTLPVLEGKLGPLLFQFPGNFRANLPAMNALLSLIPAGLLCAFEFRHASWIDEGVADLLRAGGHSLCIADTDENPAGEIVATASWGYLRLRRSDYTDGELTRWMERIGSQPWQQAFVFFKHEDKAKGPELAMRFQKLAASGL